MPAAINSFRTNWVGGKCTPDKTQFVEVEGMGAIDCVSNVHKDQAKAALSQWIQGKSSANDSSVDQLKFDLNVVQRAASVRHMQNLATKVAVVSLLLAAISLMVASGIYTSWVIHQFMIGLFGLSLPIPPSLIMWTVAGSVLGSMGLASMATNCVLARSKVFREERLQSKEFKNFVSEYLEKDLKFKPSKADLMDRKLHNIYLKWGIRRFLFINQPDGVCLRIRL